MQRAQERLADKGAAETLEVRHLSAELRDWLEHEQERASDFLQSIKTERPALLQSVSMPGAVAHWGTSIRITALTSKISSWNREIEDRVGKELAVGAASPFHDSPRPIQGTPTSGDLDRLDSYVQERAQAIKKLLG
jgi:hypothetical protein